MCSHFNGQRRRISLLFQLYFSWLSDNHSVPAQALPAVELDHSVHDENLAVHATLLEHLDMDEQLTFVVDAIGGEQWFTSTEAAKLVLVCPTHR